MTPFIFLNFIKTRISVHSGTIVLNWTPDSMAYYKKNTFFNSMKIQFDKKIMLSTRV